MKRTQNRFYVESLDDGTTLHGELLSTLPLSQAWSGVAAVPDWTQAANQPIVYVDLLSNSSRVAPNPGGTWYYNGTAITWASSSATAVSTDGRFQKVASDDPALPTATEAIKIIANLAQNNNADTDSISYTGSYTIGGVPLTFRVSTLVRISAISSNGIFGQIYFAGSNVIEQDNQDVVMYGRLFKADGSGEIIATATGTPFTTLWKMNNVVIPPSSGAGQDITYDGVTYKNAKKVNENDVIDYTIIECTFTYQTTIEGQTTTLTYTAFVDLNDKFDHDMMYIQYDGANNKGASLKRGGSVTFKMWMGLDYDPTVDTSWTDWYVRLLDADANDVTDSLDTYDESINDVENVSSSDPHYRYRELNIDNENKATITINYNLVREKFSGYLTGLILAEGN